MWAQRFRRRSEAEDEEAAAHEAAVRGSDSDDLSCASDDERDGTFRVAQALEAEGAKLGRGKKGRIKRQVCASSVMGTHESRLTIKALADHCASQAIVICCSCSCCND